MLLTCSGSEHDILQDQRKIFISKTEWQIQSSFTRFISISSIQGFWWSWWKGERQDVLRLRIWACLKESKNGLIFISWRVSGGAGISVHRITNHRMSWAGRDPQGLSPNLSPAQDSPINSTMCLRTLSSSASRSWEYSFCFTDVFYFLPDQFLQCLKISTGKKLWKIYPTATCAEWPHTAVWSTQTWFSSLG